MSGYRLVLGPWKTGPTFEVGSYGAVGMSFDIDSGDQLQFDMPGFDPAVVDLDELATDVWLYQEAVLRQRYRVIQINEAWDADGGQVLTVMAVSYKRLLNGRNVQTPLTYSAKEQSEIVWGLVQHTQAQPGGDFGITAGTLLTGTLRDRNYEIGDNIGKVLGDLSGVINGPYWNVDANLKLDVKPYDVFDEIDTPIVLGVTARTMQRSSSAALFGNSAIVTGDNEATVPVSVDALDITDDPRGRWEQVSGYPSVVLQSTLDERADGMLQRSLSPLSSWSVELEPFRFFADMPLTPGVFVTIVVPAVGRSASRRRALAVKRGQVANVGVSLSDSGEVVVKAEVLEVADPIPCGRWDVGRWDRVVWCDLPPMVWDFFKWSEAVWQ